MKADFKTRPILGINEMKYLYKCETLWTFIYSIFVAFSKKTLTLHLIKFINNYLTFSAFMRFPLEINSRNFCSSRRNFISIIFFGFSKWFFISSRAEKKIKWMWINRQDGTITYIEKEIIIHIAKCKCSGRALGAKMKGRVFKINGFPFKYLHTRLIMCKTAKRSDFRLFLETTNPFKN